ncbi:MAG: hypothetical protein HC927_12420 [Deltaproteobacteria bacterium]|nr:hypothetical protein [Deltaproteobacteria bacterium]
MLELAEAFLQEICEGHGVDVVLGAEAKLALMSESWPGNVRELRNAVQQAAFIKQRGVIGSEDLRLDAKRDELRRMGQAIDEGRTYENIHRAIDAILLPRVVAECDGNLTQAAKRLGINRDTLRAKLKGLGERT